MSSNKFEALVVSDDSESEETNNREAGKGPGKTSLGFYIILLHIFILISVRSNDVWFVFTKQFEQIYEIKGPGGFFLVKDSRPPPLNRHLF